MRKTLGNYIGTGLVIGTVGFLYGCNKPEPEPVAPVEVVQQKTAEEIAQEQRLAKIVALEAKVDVLKGQYQHEFVPNENPWVVAKNYLGTEPTAEQVNQVCLDNGKAYLDRPAEYTRFRTLWLEPIMEKGVQRNCIPHPGDVWDYTSLSSELSELEADLAKLR